MEMKLDLYVNGQPLWNARPSDIEAGRWSVACNGLWMPGIYDSEATARSAVDFTDKQLWTLDPVWRDDGENRPATMADLDRLAADIAAKEAPKKRAAE